MASDLFLRPGDSSESLVEDELPAEEIAPTVTVEPVTERVAEKVRYARQQSKCEVCGRQISTFRMATHMKYKHPADGSEPAKRPTTRAGRAPGEKKPTVPRETSGRRVKADDILTLLTGGVGSLLMVSGISPPTGMALRLEAPMLGPELDSAAAGTIVDKAVLQPLVKTKGRFDKVGPLVLFPALVFALDKSPQMLPQLYPMLRMTMAQMLPGLVSAMRKQAEDAKKLQAAADELAKMDPGFAEMFAEGGDPIDAMIKVIFASNPQEPEAEVEVEFDGSEPGGPTSAWDARVG